VISLRSTANNIGLPRLFREDEDGPGLISDESLDVLKVEYYMEYLPQENRGL